jgi:hypothetical protein
MGAPALAWQQHAGAAHAKVAGGEGARMITGAAMSAGSDKATANDKAYLFRLRLSQFFLNSAACHRHTSSREREEKSVGSSSNAIPMLAYEGRGRPDGDAMPSDPFWRTSNCPAWEAVASTLEIGR